MRFMDEVDHYETIELPAARIFVNRALDVVPGKLTVTTQCVLFQREGCPAPNKAAPNCGPCEKAISDHRLIKQELEKSRYVCVTDSEVLDSTATLETMMTSPLRTPIGASVGVRVIHSEGSVKLIFSTLLPGNSMAGAE